MGKIKVENLIKDYGNHRVLNELSFGVNDGEFLCIMGKSGCGKSTLLRILGLIDRPTSGKVIIDSKETSKITGDELSAMRQENIGFIFQEFFLIDSLTIEENIVLPMYLAGEDYDSVKEELDKNLIDFGLTHIRKSYPYNVSGGERQRAAIARATINNPNIIFADEPTGNLDIKNSKMIIDYMVDINKNGQTILMVTHDPTMASFSDRVLFMQDGKIIKSLNKNDMDNNIYKNKIIESMEY